MAVCVYFWCDLSFVTTFNSTYPNSVTEKQYRLPNTIEGIYMRSKNVNSLLTYVF